MRLSRVASVFLKRRIRPRYIRIEVNAKFPGAVCVAPVPLPVAYSNHRRPVETMRVDEGEGASGNWEERKRNEVESEWTAESIFFGDRCKGGERMGEDGFEIYIKAEMERIGECERREGVKGWWGKETSEWMKRRKSWLENEKGIVRIKYLSFVYVYKR